MAPNRMRDDLTARFAGCWDPSLPSPSLEELTAYHGVVGGEVFTPHVPGSNAPRALAVCTMQSHRVGPASLRLFMPLGHDLYDYPQVWADSDESLTELLSVIRRQARAAGADAVSFPAIVLPEGLTPPPPLRRADTRVFDARAVAEGWNWFVNKKSLRYQRNKLRRLFRYEARHVCGDIRPEDLEELGALHRERWRMDGVRSPFHDAERGRAYLCRPENKVLTTLTVNGEPLAMNFAMLAGDTLLWHTVAINVKYLDHSPIQVLLLETSEFCKAQGLQMLDFGVGDEPYKERFANARRAVYEAFLPLTPRARALEFARAHVDAQRVRERLSAARTAAGRAKGRWVTRGQTVVCYETTGRADAPDGEARLDVPDAFEDFVDLARRLDLPLERMHHERYAAGARFAALHDGRQLLSQGWVTRAEPFWIEETDRHILLDGSVMLFDFETPPAQRRRGYYTTLLRGLLARYPGETVRIYALSGNAASNKAIRRAGFDTCPLWPAAPRESAP